MQIINFDTQIDTGLIEDIGYSISDAKSLMRVQAATGDAHDGYIVEVKEVMVLGKEFESVTVGVYDFVNFSRYGIDGLLGFDIIKQLHLEMDGPTGELKIF